MIDTILNIVNKFIPDASKQADLKMQLTSELTKQQELQSKIILSEANSDSWLTRNWRPLASVVFLCMIIVHWIMYLIIPYCIQLFDLNVWMPQYVEMSPFLWDLMELCLGGYIGARTAEKVVKIYKG